MNRKRRVPALFNKKIGIAFLCLLFLTLIFWVLFLLEKNNLIEEHKLKISDFVQATVAILSTLIALGTVILAYRSTRSVQKATEGELYLNIMRKYASEEMISALRLLGSNMDYFHSQPQNIESWCKQLESARKKQLNSTQLTPSEINAINIDHARHTIKYFYRDLMQLCQGEYFSMDVALRICNTGGRHVFKKVVLEMEPYVNIYANDEEFYPFDEIYNKLEK